MKKLKPKWMNSAQVIRDLVSILSEHQLLEYARSIGLDQYTVSSSQHYLQLTLFFEKETQNEGPERVQRMRDELTDFILETGVPPLGGMRFQEKVARWIKNKGDPVLFGEKVRGALTHQKYHDVDIHVEKKGLLGKKHVWIETKVTTVGRPIIEKLERSATDVHLAKHRGQSDWAPNLLMVVSMRGFTEPALDLANSRSIYCVTYDARSNSSRSNRGRRYHFLGKMSEADYNKGKNSNYPKHPSTTQ